ncbi:MAG: YggS family pyridoxal phosphate-dependent enzyme [Akkermansiaceae bacterium]|nr:YggS family pyridoxal phosphate-dependent enzyme [Akkermansiaceae bacterium]
MTEIASRLEEVRGRVADAARRSGRAPDEVELLVVSKTWPVDVIGEVVAAGHRLFGENKVQEAEEKIPRLASDLRWHFIGHLQRNKVRKVLPLVEAVHSIDSLKLANHANRVAEELGVHPDVYLDVNVGREGSKHGFNAEELRGELDALLGLDRLQVCGLMCIPPAAAEADDARKWFAALRALRDDLERRSGVPLPKLSMGMSHDYEVAIEEGSTIVRVGSAIFGPRKTRMAAGGPDPEPA